MHKSWLLQELLNYFDETDVRVRENPHTIDAQLLNIAAERLEDLELRMSRELSAKTLRAVPSHIDNRGIYYAVRVPPSFYQDHSSAPSVVEGLRNGQWQTIYEYDDTLPVPSRIELDPDGTTVSMVSPLVFTTTGAGDTDAQIWEVKVPTLTQLKVPNKLTFYLSGMNTYSSDVNILITGHVYPSPTWRDERTEVTEILVISDEGSSVTAQIWAEISSIVVRGLPANANLKCWNLPFDMPSYSDDSRPHVSPFYRDQRYRRSWQVDNQYRYLKELYFTNNFAGMEIVDLHSTEADITAMVIEPHTNGMLVAMDTNVIYVDRRAMMPGNLTAMGIKTEPLFGLEVLLDVTKYGSARYVQINPISYANAGKCRRWRYVVQDPDGLVYVIADSSFAPYTGAAGWRWGNLPTTMNLPLTKVGTWTFSLECADEFDVLYTDTYLYINKNLSAVRKGDNLPAFYDLATVVPTVKGLAFDAFGKLWAWTGTFAVPLKLRYDSYVYDESLRTVFLTDKFDAIRLS